MARTLTPLGAVTRGLLAAAAGTALMDLQQYLVYRAGGGQSGFTAWEFGGINSWKDAATPGQVGKRLIEAWRQQPPPDSWAQPVNTAVHWGFGIQWGLVYGLVAGSATTSPLVLGPAYGAGVWLFGYAVLPLGGFYRPIWTYSPTTLGKDLFSHLVYAGGTAAAFRLLSAFR